MWTVKGLSRVVYMYPCSPKFPCHPGCHMTLSRVPCAIEQGLTVLEVWSHWKAREVLVELDPGSAWGPKFPQAFGRKLHMCRRRLTRPGRQQLGAPWPEWRLGGLKDITYWPEGRHVPEHTGGIPGNPHWPHLFSIRVSEWSCYSDLPCLTHWLLCKGFLHQILPNSFFISLSVTVDYLQLLLPSVDLTMFGCFFRHLDFRATTHFWLGQCLIRTGVGMYRAGTCSIP